MTKPVPESVRLRVLNQHPDETVRVYSIQSQDVLEAARARGYLTRETFEVKEPGDEEWKRAYDWMRDRMAERIEGYNGEYPIWAWLKRPNMRQWTWIGPGHSLVVADVPRGRMILSDYDAWHHPLNGWRLHATEASFDKHYHDDGSKEDVEQSWMRVLDMADRTDPAERAWLGPTVRPQLCVHRIYLNEIVRITPVTGRKRSRWQQLPAVDGAD